MGVFTLFPYNLLNTEDRKKKNIGKDVYHQRID